MSNNQSDNQSKNKVRNQASSNIIIGWREYASLPELDIERVKVKIDTGARSSALHAFNIQERSQNGKQIISFQVHPQQRDSHTTITTEAELLEYRQIRNSGGKAQLRPVIKTNIQVGAEIWTIELSLTNRDVMGFRMLLGRQGVRNKFLVDPGRSFLLSSRKS